MWQLCHFESNPEWVILNLKGNNVNIVLSSQEKMGKLAYRNILLFTLLKEYKSKNFVSPPQGGV